MLKRTVALAAAGAVITVPSLSAAQEPGGAAAELTVSVAGHEDVDAHMQAAAREQRRQRRAARAHARRLRAARRRRAHARVKVSPVLARIAACESGGNPRAVGGGGRYRGKYQFSFSTWASVGGKGDPAAAPEREQDMRAARLYARAGASPWPVCGR